ncbi:hypothetical protein KW850_32300 [Bacillus sp. sid0103]|uniref:hypothetical protein n=1 Tax=Bacillus sp. sid0103 TaxID=2856337 RepID=UPI001C45840D|nr:hypothetical protein [Bacillus sp. sid0103]MBV7509761.1 hypothetical protein [Bacillus sp. sid0103]
MNEEFQELLKQNEISNIENPTESDIKKIFEQLPLLELKANNELDKTMIQEYYKYVATILPNVLKTVNDLASQNLGKEVINSFNKRIDALNKRYEIEKDPEELKRIQQEISNIFDRIEKVSDKQTTFLKQLAFGAMGTIAILGGIAIGIKNKEAGKKIVEEGIKVIKG